MLLEILRNHMSEKAATILFPLIFVVLFLVIGGGALWLTPRIAAWLDRQQAKNKNFYDGMLEHDPNDPAAPPPEEQAGPQKEEKEE